MSITKSGVGAGIALPQTFFDGRFNRQLVSDYVTATEEAGYDDFWLTEGILSPNFYLEPVTYLSYVAALTTRIRLGVSVIILPVRNPVQLAKQLACLDQMSDGRLTVGLGLGGTRNYAAFGVPEERRVARFSEAVNVMKALWGDEPANLDGDFWKLEGARMAPKPFQKPHPPLWFGAHSDAALRRAVRNADGWMGAGSTLNEDFFEEIVKVKQFMAEGGRDASNFTLSKRVYIAVDEDQARAREKLTQALAFQYGNNVEFAAKIGLAATPEGAIEMLNRMRDTGIQHFCLQTCYDHMKQMETIREKVLPYI